MATLHQRLIKQLQKPFARDERLSRVIAKPSAMQQKLNSLQGFEHHHHTRVKQLSLRLLPSKHEIEQFIVR
jgi:hypothetical protein